MGPQKREKNIFYYWMGEGVQGQMTNFFFEGFPNLRTPLLIPSNLFLLYVKFKEMIQVLFLMSCTRESDAAMRPIVT